MNLPRSTYYYKPKKQPLDETELTSHIEAIIEEFPGYGYRRVAKELHRQGILVNHKKILRIMRQRGLIRKPRRRWIRTTNSNHRYRIYPNLVQNLAVTGPNQVWVSDITYISIQSTFVYLAVILDLFSRKAVGYAISPNIDTALSLAALIMAIVNRKPPKGIIHHSDQGVQYACQSYVDRLETCGAVLSMSRPGCPWENGRCESFIKTLKHEELDARPYRTLEELREHVTEFIEQIYNLKRLHSALEYRSPIEFENQHAAGLGWMPATLSFMRHEEIYSDGDFH